MGQNGRVRRFRSSRPGARRSWVPDAAAARPPEEPPTAPRPAPEPAARPDPYAPRRRYPWHDDPNYDPAVYRRAPGQWTPPPPAPPYPAYSGPAAPANPTALWHPAHPAAEPTTRVGPSGHPTPPRGEPTRTTPVGHPAPPTAAINKLATAWQAALKDSNVVTRLRTT